jgi:hypothetical protein
MFLWLLVSQYFSLVLSDSQLRTALAIILRGDVDKGWWNHYGLKCASWTAVNSGTSGRAPCSSIGNIERASDCFGTWSQLPWEPDPCINTSIYILHQFTCFHLRKPPSSNNFDSNLKNHYTIASSPLWVPAMRMLLLMMVAVCLNAVITLEQPFSSFFEFYPRFRDFIRMLQHTGGPHAVPWPWVSKR